MLLSPRIFYKIFILKPNKTNLFIMLNPYIQHREVILSQFASRNLFEIAKELMDKNSPKGFLIHFENHLNEIPCSFRKHGFKIIEQTLRAQYEKDLFLDFDKTGKKEEKSALDELFLGEKITSEQNADFEIICENLRSYFKAKSHLFERKTLE